MEPEKRLSLPEWQDKIALKSKCKDYKEYKELGKELLTLSEQEFANLLLEHQALKEYHAQEVSFLQSQIPQWVSVETFLPHCWETGKWDGERSDLVIVQVKCGDYHIARLYKGAMDGSYFEDWYDKDDFEIAEAGSVIKWKPFIY